MDDNYQIKHAALSFAVKVHGIDDRPADVVAYELATLGDLLAMWLASPVVSLTVIPDRFTYNQLGGTPQLSATIFAGGKVELKDNQQVPLTVHAKDAKGFDTNEAGDVVITWDTSDAAVVSLQPSADGLTCEAVAGVPGSALVTVSDGTRSGSLAFDVTPGGVSSITVEAGVPEDQPPAP